MSIDSPRPAHIARWLDLWPMALFAAGYLVATYAGNSLASPLGFAVFWPASGVALAGLLLAPRRRWPGLLALIVLSNFAVVALAGRQRPVVALLFGLVDAAEAALAAFAVTRFARPPATMATLREVVVLMVAAAGAANAVTSVAASLVAAALGLAPALRFLPMWFVSNGVGMVTVAPIVLASRAAWPEFKRVVRQDALEFAAQMAAVVAVAAVAFGLVEVGGPLPRYGFLVLPVLLWPSLRFGTPAAATAALLAVVMAVASSVQGLGPLVDRPGLPATSLILANQLFMAVMALVALLPAAVISEQRRLRREGATYRQLSEQARDPILLVRFADRRIVLANAAAARFYGYAPEELASLTVTDLRPPEARDAVAADIGAASANPDGLIFETIHQKRDGTRVPVEVSTRGVSNEGGRFMLSVVRDITDRRELESQLLQAQKMEAIGRLAGGIAHDFNNLLTVIQGYAETAADDLPAGDPRRQPLDEVLHATARASALTRQLLAFSRKQVLQPVPLDLNTVVAETERMLRRIIGEDVVLATDLAEGIPAVRADLSQLQQVLLNLAVNARDAMPHGGRLLISTSIARFTETRVRRRPEAADGRWVALTVSDTGVGIPEGIREQIFEPFFTTKPRDKGTGLGLSTVYGIVRQSGGHVEFDSEPGVGTTFRLYFPASDAEPARPAPPPSGPSGGTERILVVDDDDLVRGLVERMLARAGYEVVPASDGPSALAELERLDGAVHLLLTDVVMPKMGGVELAGLVRARYPSVRVLLMSGFSDETAASGLAEGGLAFIPKPFSVTALTSRVRGVLDA